MQQWDSYKEFLDSTYKNWVPTYQERHDHGPSKEILARPATFFAFTDYGGTFYDKVACDFLREHAPDEDLLWQYTVYNGMNLLYLGPITGEMSYWRFPKLEWSFEDYYEEAERAAEDAFYRSAAEDLVGDGRKRLCEWAHSVLLDEMGSQYSVGSDGQVDVTYSRCEEVLRQQWPLRHER
jgi:hypothetical protein